MVQTAICLPKISQLFTIIFWTATNALYLTVWSWKKTRLRNISIKNCDSGNSNPEFATKCVILICEPLYIRSATYIVSHQLHDSLFRCNFVEYLSATGIMTNKFTNIMTSHAQSLKNHFLKDLMVSTISYLTIMCRFQNMNDIFEHFIFFFNKSMAIVPPKLLIGMNWAPR